MDAKNNHWGAALIGMILIFTSLQPAFAMRNANLTLLFNQYQTTLDQFIHELSKRSWQQAENQASSLLEQSQNFLKLGLQNENHTWEYYASNLVHHCLELQEAVKGEDSVEAIYLTAILLSHIGQIQSSVPRWLADYMNDQIQIIETSLQTRNTKAVRDAAEIIHDGASKIIFSISSAPHEYTHTRWVTNIEDMNRLGDALLGEVNDGQWENSKQKLEQIRFLYHQWVTSFQPPTMDVTP
ncbi:MAG: hypothetical protein H7832_07630 [Magnetococcus sp. DMHC-6]